MCIKGINIGSSNNQWKGDEVKYGSLHDWVKYHLEKPDKCSNCGEIKKLDLANISQKYKRDLSDWEWLCRRCHMIKDGRMEKIVHRPAKTVEVICTYCKKKFNRLNYRIIMNTVYCSRECYFKNMSVVQKNRSSKC